MGSSARSTGNGDRRRWAGGLGRELDDDGVPRRWEVARWWDALASLADARRGVPDAGAGEDEERVAALALAALRFARPDGSAVFDPPGRSKAHAELLRFWAAALRDPALGRVVDAWFARRRRNVPRGPLPPPAFGSTGRPLAALRTDWSTRGALLALDGRGQGAGRCLVELFARGARLLGPGWSLDDMPDDAPSGDFRPAVWSTGPQADLVEWSGRVGPVRLVRTALLLRGRSLALLADQIRGPKLASGMRLSLAPGVTATAVPDLGALMLTRGPRSASARVLPIGLPAAVGPDRGLTAVEGSLVLRPPRGVRAAWLPLLVSWDADRNRKATTWRPLTVTERSRVCPPEVAFAARVSWGSGDQLLIYRSLARPGLRAVLGHQTRARFLVGLFTKEGDVVPLIRLD